MRRYIYIFFVLCFSCISCTKELGKKDYGDDCIILNVANSPLTKAIESNSGEAYERKIKSLDCFFYVKGKTSLPCTYYHKIENLDNDGRVEIPIYVEESVIDNIFPDGNTTCDVFVIANLPEDIIPNDITFGNGATGTELSSLGQYVLDKQEGNYDAIDKTFVMAALSECRKDSKKNALATISLVRAAAKVTFSVHIPESIVISEKDGEGNDVIHTYRPVITDNTESYTLKTALHNIADSGYLHKTTPVEEKVLSASHKMSFIRKADIAASGDSPLKYNFTCEIPFYTYAREWEKGASDAAYWTFELPWGYDSTGDGNIDTYQTYYYQILINGAGRSFEPNHWYDMTVNVGVLGSTVETIPVVLDKMSYFVIDWSEDTHTHTAGGNHEDVELDSYRYLSVENNLLQLNNQTTGTIKYSASHKIGIMLNTNSKEIYGYPEEYTTFGACKVNSNVSKPTDPIMVQINTIGTSNFTDNNKGNLTFTNTDFDNIYSPIHVYITIWLDIDGDGQMDMGSDEAKLTEDITIVQYPPMYVVPDWSTLKSIYVNGVRHSQSSDGNNVIINGHRLGNASGIKNNDGNNARINNPMYIVSVSSFRADNKFLGPTVNDNGSLDINNRIQYNYIIGDPRQRTNDIEMDNGAAYAMKDEWAESNAILYDANGNIIKDGDGKIQYGERSLQYYYPTASEGYAFQVVAPKFRIVSFNNASRKLCSPAGAAMRCATLQEDGFPAGRWRLPTIAEVQYIISLQNIGAIAGIFTSSSSYYATASYSNVDKTSRVTLTTDGTSLTWSTRTGNDISVRCVYDEWYWGSEREAKQNTTPNNTWNTTDVNNILNVGDTYAFTWGDKQVFPEVN